MTALPEVNFPIDTQNRLAPLSFETNVRHTLNPSGHTVRGQGAR
ncbi:hypothetical protein SAMN00790413_05231 [Deinococcus hopiensis KR-140]|uniref:Uncharacterized protein n=1 Tax=Deinococcus hopiensis KR-140 TaxID=695939 RepID=A0A1W1UUB0_9DEIO|nr:hypothetical protein SAMN00790413_05231 [Deinococcus hopiensis KR-140]